MTKDSYLDVYSATPDQVLYVRRILTAMDVNQATQQLEVVEARLGKPVEALEKLKLRDMNTLIPWLKERAKEFAARTQTHANNGGKRK